jgi:hypothetical protein
LAGPWKALLTIAGVETQKPEFRILFPEFCILVSGGAYIKLHSGDAARIRIKGTDVYVNDHLQGAASCKRSLGRSLELVPKQIRIPGSL